MMGKNARKYALEPQFSIKKGTKKMCEFYETVASTKEVKS